MRPARPDSAPAGPSRPVLALLILLGGTLVYATQGLLSFLGDAGRPALRSPWDLLPELHVITLGGPVAWMLAMAAVLLPRRRIHPLATTLAGLAAYLVGLALALMPEDASMRSGGWDLGWEFAFVFALITGTWVPAPLVSLALTLVTRRR